jgi:hypothetical protein
MSSTNIVTAAGEEPKKTLGEVVGLPVKEASEIIIKDKPDGDTPATKDLSPDHVPSSPTQSPAPPVVVTRDINLLGQ